MRVGNRAATLASIPATIRFVSAEPLLGPIRFGRGLRNINWVTTGCEQAKRGTRREMDADWVRGIRDECDAAGIALFHKQYYIGNQLQYDGLLDGQVYQEFPVTVAS